MRRSARGESAHYRIPEGTFFVTGLNDESSYYRAFVISYPGPTHRSAGSKPGSSRRPSTTRIVRADQDGVDRTPPMGTRLGGLIEIHGSGSGRQRAWTRGCVALRNVHMDELWEIVGVGTPVVIEPYGLDGLACQPVASGRRAGCVGHLPSPTASSPTARGDAKKRPPQVGRPLQSARDWTRTSTDFTPHAPQACVSTNFTTWAGRLTSERTADGSARVTPVGLEPTTRWLKASCSAN